MVRLLLYLIEARWRIPGIRSSNIHSKLLSIDTACNLASTSVSPRMYSRECCRGKIDDSKPHHVRSPDLSGA